MGSRALQGGRNPEGNSPKDRFFLRGHDPEVLTPDLQMSRGFPEGTSKMFGVAVFALSGLLDLSKPFLSLSRLFSTVEPLIIMKTCWF